MNGKRILVYVTAVAVIAGSSTFVYATKNSVDATKNVVESTVVEAEKKETKTGYISDEEAVEIATKGMKDYLNKDADYYTSTSVNRQDWSKNTEIEVEGQKYMVSEDYARWIQYRLDDNDIEGAKEQLQDALKQKPNIIMVSFAPKDFNRDRWTANGVDIDADTGEILSLIAQNNLEEFKGEVDTKKLKESVLNFFNRINTEVDEESILGKYDVDTEYGRVIMHLNLIGGKKVSIDLDIRDYSVITYSKDYLLWPEE